MPCGGQILISGETMAAISSIAALTEKVWYLPPSTSFHAVAPVLAICCCAVLDVLAGNSGCSAAPLQSGIFLPNACLPPCVRVHHKCEADAL